MSDVHLYPLHLVDSLHEANAKVEQLRAEIAALLGHRCETCALWAKTVLRPEPRWDNYGYCAEGINKGTLAEGVLCHRAYGCVHWQAKR